LKTLIPEEDLLKKICEYSKIDEAFMHNILAESRVIKNDDEIKIMRWASQITCEAHCNVMKNCMPGMRES
jgi:Xaa-Pro aminopeptidase